MPTVYDPLADEDRFERFVGAMHRLTNQEGSLRYLSPSLRPFSRDSVAAYTRGHRDSGLEYVVRQVGGDIVAIGAWRRHDAEGFELFMAVVDEAHRRNGFARAFVELAVRTASGEGYRCVNASVFADNAAMLCVLLREGFVPIRMTHRVRADGADLVLLRRALP